MAFRKFLSDNKVILDPVKADIDRRFMDLKVSETFLDRGHMLRNYCSSCSLPLCYFLPLSLKLNVLGKFHFTAKFLSGSAFILFFPQLVVKRDCQLPVGVRTNFRKSRLHALWLACLRKYWNTTNFPLYPFSGPLFGVNPVVCVSSELGFSSSRILSRWYIRCYGSAGTFTLYWLPPAALVYRFLLCFLIKACIWCSILVQYFCFVFAIGLFPSYFCTFSLLKLHSLKPFTLCLVAFLQSSWYICS